MAGIDKIYGTQEQFLIFRKWLEENKPEALMYLYPGDGYPDLYDRPISNFPEWIDKWLLKNCQIEFIQKAIKEQYGIKPKKRKRKTGKRYHNKKGK